MTKSRLDHSAPLSGSRRHALVMIALLALALTACFNERDENTNEGTNPSGGAVAVEVLLTDDGIEMPLEIIAGPVLFEVTNAGSEPHGFVIENALEGDWLDELQPDQLDTVEAELEPGTYTVYSPVDGDREAGLELEVNVAEGDGDGGAPLGDEGVGPGEEQEPVEDEGD